MPPEVNAPTSEHASQVTAGVAAPSVTRNIPFEATTTDAAAS